MRLKELLLFARNGGGSGILPAAARALRLPMPDDVLEQFVLDHGLNHDFQTRYADLDLYAISWSLELVQTATIVACTTKFDKYLGEVAECYAGATSLQCMVHLETRRSWVDNGTWIRPPVFLCDVLPPPDENHLVEGHTRVGTLTGFHRNPRPPVRVSPSHACWIGRPSVDLVSLDWRSVRRQYPISFKRWLYAAREGSAEVASALIDAEHQSRYEVTVGDDFEDLARLISVVSVPAVTIGTLKELHARWAAELEQ